MENFKEGIVLFGGSFDPVQKSHAEIIKKLSARFERVIVLPSFISPFKKGEQAASGALRLQMLNDITEKLDNVTVSDFELNKGGVSYTIDSVLHLAAQFAFKPLYFAIGTDMVKGLPRWNRIDELKELVTFYVVPRDGFVMKDSQAKRLQKNGIQLVQADFLGGGASSSHAKLDIAFGKFDLLPKRVASQIQKNNFYADYTHIVDSYKEFNLDEERIGHTYRTAKLAITLAKIHKAPVGDAIVAALLHDIAKNTSASALAKMGIALGEECLSAPEKVRHAFLGAAVAKSQFGIKKKAILDAIYHHTTGAPRMGKLAKIIYLADLCEEGRDEYEDLAEIRALAASNLNAAMRLALKGSIDRIEKKGKDVYYLTRDAYESFLPKPKAQSVKSDSVRVEPKAVAYKPADKSEAYKLARIIAALLDEKKARDIALIDLGGKTIVADYFVIATVGSTTAVRALTDYVDESLSKQHGIEPLRRDLDAKWAAIDYGSIILHIQTDEIRSFYDLERLWNDGSNTERI